MPKKAVDYNNTHFYKIVCKDLNIADLYVGHTTAFRNRKNHHKKCCNNQNRKDYNRYVYKFIRDNGGWDNWDMILIETTTCDNKLDAMKRERIYIEDLTATLNQRTPSRTQKEWREEHKEDKRDYDRKYRKANTDKKKEIDRLYRENNKDKITSYKTEQFECPCGGRYTRHHKTKHERSIRHQQYLESIKEA
jgi:hypothetical protein